MIPSPALVVVDGLAKRYGRQRVLDGVSFQLRTGTLTVLAGTNGAGKSTLLRCLAGLARFDGAASVGSQPLDGSPVARRLVGYVPQRVALPENGTVGEVLDLFALLRGASPQQGPFTEDFVPPRDRRLGVLSGGQRQRVVVAAALLGQPRLLLLDEPAANLDDAGRAALWQGLRAAVDGGAAVLVASPSPGDLVGVADREVTLSDGRVTRDEAWTGLHAAGLRARPGALPVRDGDVAPEGVAR